MERFIVSLTLIVTTSLPIAAHAVGAHGQPNPVYSFEKFHTKLREVPNGVLYSMDAPDNASLLVMHLYGGAEERGIAHGMLLHDELLKFFSDLEGRAEGKNGIAATEHFYTCSE